MKLHEQVKELKAANASYEEGLLEIIRYLNLPKFSKDTSVNKDDIFLRINEIRNNIAMGVN